MIVFTPRPTHLVHYLLLLTLFLSAVGLGAQQNPFLSGGGSGETGEDDSVQSAEAEEVPPKSSGDFAPPRQSQNLLFQRITELQRSLYEHIASAMEAVKSRENRGQMLFIALGAAFLYGMLHALGPGHRKTVIFSYFLAEDAPVLQGVAAGVLMAVLHGAAAAALILPIYYILRGSLLITFNSVSLYIEIATFAFIAAFGGIMLIYHLIQFLRGAHGHDQGHGPSPSTPTSAEGGHDIPRQRRRKNLLLLVIGSGLVPCPGAAMVLMFALSMQMTAFGLMAVGAMSLGMAVTISAVAVLTLGARATLQRGAEKHHQFTTILHTTLELGGYSLIFIFGLVMTLGLL